MNIAVCRTIVFAIAIYIAPFEAPCESDSPSLRIELSKQNLSCGEPISIIVDTQMQDMMVQASSLTTTLKSVEVLSVSGDPIPSRSLPPILNQKISVKTLWLNKNTSSRSCFPLNAWVPTPLDRGAYTVRVHASATVGLIGGKVVSKSASAKLPIKIAGQDLKDTGIYGEIYEKICEGAESRFSECERCALELLVCATGEAAVQYQLMLLQIPLHDSELDLDLEPEHFFMLAQNFRRNASVALCQSLIGIVSSEDRRMKEFLGWIGKDIFASLICGMQSSKDSRIRTVASEYVARHGCVQAPDPIILID